MIRKIVALLFGIFATTLQAGETVNHGVVLLYHHVSDTTPSSTSISPSAFTRQIAYLDQNGYQVIALDEILSRLYSGKGVPDNSVAITFDDAYESVYSTAFPVLSRLNWPFTVFVADEAVSNNYRRYMNWQQLARLVENGASIGAHSVSHAHLVYKKAEESENQWLSRVTAEITSNVDQLESRLNTDIRSFAYPYGEYNSVLQSLIEKAGLYGLAQHSGAVGPGVPKTAIPRFPMSSGFTDLNRFATAINARPLPVKNGTGSTVMTPEDAPKTLELSIGEGAFRADYLRCYSAAGDILDINISDEGYYQITLPTFGQERKKINCTAPSLEGNNEYYWYSRLWIMLPE